MQKEPHCLVISVVLLNICLIYSSHEFSGFQLNSTSHINANSGLDQIHISFTHSIRKFCSQRAEVILRWIGEMRFVQESPIAAQCWCQQTQSSDWSKSFINVGNLAGRAPGQFLGNGAIKKFMIANNSLPGFELLNWKKCVVNNKDMLTKMIKEFYECWEFSWEPGQFLGNGAITKFMIANNSLPGFELFKWKNVLSTTKICWQRCH